MGVVKPPRRGGKGGKSAGRSRSGRRKAPPRKKGKAAGTRPEAGGVLAILVAFLAFMVAAALFPIEVLGSRVADFFPDGNPVGEAGELLRRALVSWLGLGSVAVPLGLLAAAASIGGWSSPSPRRSLWIIVLASAILFPLGGFLFQGGEWAHGYLGTALGDPLRRAIGWLGAWLLFGTGVIVTCIAALRFNPLRPAGLAAAALYRGAGWAARRTGTATRTGWTRLAERRRAARAAREAAKRAAEEKARARREPYGGAGAGNEGAQPVEEHLGEGQGDGDQDGVKGAIDPATAPDEGDASEAAGAAEMGSDGNGIEAAATQARSREPKEAAVPGGAAASDGAAKSSVGDDAPAQDEPLPPFDLLTAPRRENRFGMEQELDRLGHVLVEKLRTFKIESEVSGRTTGPAVTQYEVVPAAGVKVNRIANLDADLALAMKARSVRIVAPIPGKGAVGVEIPNPRPEIVRLREILEASAFSRSRDALPLGMGKDLAGDPYVTDLTRMPHALIAGATGSGKSVCLNTIITSLVYRHGPDRLRLLMIDPKMVELSAYADLPHLRHPVVTDPREAAGILKWAVMEMERRYALLSANGVRSLKEFNDRVERGVELKLAAPDGPEEEEDSWRYRDGSLPWIVVVVDELADLMMTVQAEVEKPLTQLAQKARAIGIHLLVATQRPSVNVITGLIKANFPCRIAFRVASKTDSRTILDQNGADSLLGYGDMLFLPPGQSEPVRMQGAFISTEETEALMGWYRERADTLEAIKARVQSDETDILEQVRAAEGEDEGGEETTSWGDWDDLFRDAAQACIQQGSGSTSLLQRRLRIGYGRAARIVDQLHDAGVLGPPDGSKPREVLVGLDALDEICPG